MTERLVEEQGVVALSTALDEYAYAKGHPLLSTPEPSRGT